ncbi:restriction endonuclease subunit S [Halobacteriovorax sp. RZ-3]|uniref:restriction endonuclease subunit S n=1 Tax=Halobacteriovorax sp. RZ-3 TaxID=3157720 RepID=UPI0037218980
MSNFPTEWIFKELGELSKIVDPHPSHRAPPVVYDGIPFIGIGDIKENGNLILSKARRVSPDVFEEHSARYKITSNTIGFGRVASVGKVIDFQETDLKFAVSPTMAIIEPNGVNRLYLSYALRSQFTFEQINQKLTGTTRSSLGIEQLRSLNIPLPSEKEQKKIAEVLSSVDKVIELTEVEIEKLKNLKKGIMQDLLTKGIGHTKFKDSPIGKIPEEWEVTTLDKVSVKIGDGLHSTPKYVDRSDYYFVNGNNLKDGSIEITKSTKCVSEDEYLNHRKDLSENTILMSINGTIGNLAYYRGEPVVLGKSAAYISLESPDYLNYLYYFLDTESIKKYYDLELTGSTIKNLSLKAIRATPIAIPPKEEMEKINNSITSIDETLSGKVTKLEKVKNMKKGLMQDLLTGKVRVKV